MKIVKVRKNGDGDITNVMMDDGMEMAVSKAIALAKQGMIESVVLGKNRNGNETIRSSPNNTEADNLDNLPTF